MRKLRAPLFRRPRLFEWRAVILVCVVQPGLMEKAKDLMGTITGSVSLNESDSPSSTGTISQPNQEQASSTGGQKSYPDSAAVKKTAPPSQKE